MSDQERKSTTAIVVVLLIGLGLAFAGSQGGHRMSGVPIYAWCVAVAFLIQWIAFIPAYLNRTEVYYDLTGGLSHITVILLAVFATPEVDARSVLLAGIVIVWASRLASFLFVRIRAAGEDRRFREIKHSFVRFLLAWTPPNKTHVPQSSRPRVPEGERRAPVSRVSSQERRAGSTIAACGSARPSQGSTGHTRDR